MQNRSRITAALLLLISPCAPWARADDARELTVFIDREIEARLAEAGVAPAPLADDAEFLRRVYLDLTGNIPPYEKVAPFLDDADPDKRAKLIDELLAGDAYAKHMAHVWQLRLVDHDAVVGFGNRDYLKPMTEWLEAAFRDNKPWDQVVSEILTLEGKESPVRAFYRFDTQFATVEQFTNKLGQYFLGVQLNCAQCHDHPYKEELKQDDYWALAAFFAKLNDKSEEDEKRTEPNNKPDGYKPAAPRFLHGDAPALADAERRRPQLARWLTSAENPYFARAMVNRTWAHFFGRGLVNPIDDVRFGDDATHPELFDELSAKFTASRFDVKMLSRAIASSQAYQRTSARPADASSELYGYAMLRTLSPRQLWNARSQIAAGNGLNEKQFLAVFDLAIDPDAATYAHGMLETLRLMNGESVNGLKTFSQRIKMDDPAAGNVEALYLLVLSRRPSADEQRRAAEHLGASPTAAGYADLFWALLNCSEFETNH